jgi:hypothetical protein
VPVNTAKMCPSYHNCLFGVFVDENHYPLELIAEFALDFLILFSTDIVIYKVLASFTNERIELFLVLTFT